MSESDQPSEPTPPTTVAATASTSDAVSENTESPSTTTTTTITEASTTTSDIDATTTAASDSSASNESHAFIPPAPVDLDVPNGHGLQSAWIFWYHRKQPKTQQQQQQQQPISEEEYKDTLINLASFNTIERFWSIYSTLHRPADLPKDANLYLFRQGFMPMWEDYPLGGCWNISVNKKSGKLAVMWEELLFAAIGEAFEEPEVVGVALSIRSKEDVLSVWNRSNQHDEVRFKIGERLKRILHLEPTSSIGYKFHSSSIKDRSTYRNVTNYIVS